ncbi:FAD binding domain-containing protein [Clostridium sp. Cult3]|uniref:FAD binding domain-containing protein n=1 Tax=Clostridium sp. Cult3 TaxID=2079004 RepID=UPI001F1C55C9|nr:FAD binding domain-containing protein [Clostridium sp. Cult3]MCF6459678.1 xanthine dehydrogenase [Clostridium sp. Cult3]
MALEEVYKGKSIDEVVELLGEYDKEAKIIAGGTDIVIDLRNEKIDPKVLIDISSIEELKTIKDEGEYMEIGAGVSFTQVVESPLFDGNLCGLKKACHMVGSPQIRNKGTLGGNIANGSPAADSIPPLICLNSTLILKSVRGTREIGLEDYYKDEDAKIKADELLVGIRFKKPKDGQVLSFSKLGLRKALAISRLSIATLLELDDEGKVKTIEVASGSLGKYPMRESELEQFLTGKKLDEATIDEGILVLQEAMEKRLAGRSTFPYKREAVDSMLKEALKEAMEYLNEVRL